MLTHPHYCDCDVCLNARACSTDLLVFAIALAFGLAAGALLTGCGGRVHETPAAPDVCAIDEQGQVTCARLVFSHDVRGYACGHVYTTSDRVALACAGTGPLEDACPVSAATVVSVYAEPGAGDGHPFGVSSLVEWDGAACTD